MSEGIDAKSNNCENVLFATIAFLIMNSYFKIMCAIVSRFNNFQ